MKIIGFDYDGTIINIEPQKAEAFGLLLNSEWGIERTEAEKFWIKTGGTSRRYKFDHFYKKSFSKELEDIVYIEIEKKFSKILKTKFYREVEVLPYAKELLEFTRSDFDYVFVSSGVTHEEINYLVDMNGLRTYFDEVLGTNDVYLSKHDHLKKIIDIKKPDVKIFIGDGLEDMKVAKQFGCKAIGIPTNHTLKELKEAGADEVVNLIDCPDIIGKLI